MSYTQTATATYTVADIQMVVRQVTSDLMMIASSTGAITEQKAKEYGNDIEVLASAGYLKSVDLTLMQGDVEKEAVQYDIDENTGKIKSSRPGGVLWPRLLNTHLRIILSYNEDYDAAARQKLVGKMKVSWVPTSDSTSHSSLKASGGRDYSSNGYGMHRKDWTS